MKEYEDIINMPHHVSKRHKPMPVSDRAAQFAPFAALTGHEEAIKETERLTENEAELDEYVIEDIDRRLRRIKDNIENNPYAEIVYFSPDKVKSGGKYVRYSGNIKKFNEADKTIVFADGYKVCIDAIVEID